jgi:hypothetical protein
MSSDDAQRPSDPSSPVAEPTGNPRRKKALLGVAGAVLLAGAAYGTYWASSSTTSSRPTTPTSRATSSS